MSDVQRSGAEERAGRAQAFALECQREWAFERLAIEYMSHFLSDRRPWESGSSEEPE